MNPDEPAVVTAACELALKRLFPGATTEQQITDLVAMIRSRISTPDGPAQYEAEAVIKAALTGGQVPAEMTSGRQFLIEGVLFAAACRRLDLSPDEISALVRQGERVAFAAGFNPPLSAEPSA